jgi:hypothetical protein
MCLLLVFVFEFFLKERKIVVWKQNGFFLKQNNHKRRNKKFEDGLGQRGWEFVFPIK